PASHARLFHQRGLRSRGVQGTAPLRARLEPAAAPADPAHRRAQRGVGLPAGGLPAPDLATRHARPRSARNEMPAQMTRLPRLLLTFALFVAPAPAGAAMAYVSNEKSNTVSVLDTDSWQVVRTIKVGQRPRGITVTHDGKFVLVAVGDDDTIEMIDTATN